MPMLAITWLAWQYKNSKEKVKKKNPKTNSLSALMRLEAQAIREQIKNLR